MEASSSNFVGTPSSDLGKLFVGGITDGTREDEIKDHFKKFGEVKEVVMVKDRATGNARGFVFVQFENPESAEAALVEEEHLIAGRKVEVKRAKPKSEQRWTYQSPHHQYPFPSQHEIRGLSNNDANHYCMNENPTKSKKIFVGGLPSSVTEDEFRSYFEKFGRINDVVVMYDSTTQRPRGFGFVTFDSEEAVESVMQQNHHQLSNKYVDVKLAVPRGGNNYNSSNAYNGSSYNSNIDGRRGFVNSYQGGVYPSYNPSNGFYSGYAPPASEYFYGMGGYGGGYPVGPYGGIGYVAPFISPRIPYNGPGMMRRSPMHYGNATMYQGFSDSGFGGYMGIAGGSGRYGTSWSGNGNFYTSGDVVRITEHNTRTDDGSVAVDAHQAS